MNANLKGVISGFTLKTKPEEIYRTLIEATAFGTRKIIETHEGGAEPIQEVYACGGLTKNRMLMQIYADILGKVIQVASSLQPVALGAAIFGALAAGKANGGYNRPEEAVSRMVPASTTIYQPDWRNKMLYDQIYQTYLQLHDYFGNNRAIFK